MKLGALYLAGLQAAGADVRFADMAFFIANGDLLDIGLEPAVRHTMRMADVTTGNGVLPANFAYFRHIESLQACITHLHNADLKTTAFAL